MRPSILNPLFADVTVLTGIGPKIAVLIGRVAGSRVVDLILTPPISVIDRSSRPKILDAPLGQLATFEVTVDRHDPPPKGRRLPYKVICSDDTGFVTLVFFHGRPDYLQNVLPEGKKRLVSGKIEDFKGGLQITHPDYVVDPDKPEEMPVFEAVYPLTAGLSAAVMRKAVTQAIGRTPELPEWQDEAWMAARDWSSWKSSLDDLNAPQSQNDLSLLTPARMRLAYDELLANQLALLLIRNARVKSKGRAIKDNGRLAAKARAALPFEFTGAQSHALKEIFNDMRAPDRMVRLLQGDVGSGKTVVALFAILGSVEAGAQAALMAPTEILARQHLETLSPFVAAAGVRMEILTGRDKGASRTEKAATHQRWRRRYFDRHPCNFSGDCRFQGFGAGRDRRATPLWRSSAYDADPERRETGFAGDDGNANPEDSGAHRLWRYGCEPDHRKAAGPQTG